ncbi:MAG: hypothetical protein WAT79_13135, partial [Saprospiraceae bacterium]
MIEPTSFYFTFLQKLLSKYIGFSKIVLCFSLMFLYTQDSSGQPPTPCLTGNENTCKCYTSPLLCEIDQLDGYTYSMTTYPHNTDGPYPNFMCVDNGSPVASTSHNPTWFRFPAWCEDLSLTVSYTNCVDGPGCTGCCQYGLQAAVFSECFGCPPPICFGPSWQQNSQSPSPYTYSVGCETATSGCINNSSRTVDMTGLTIGKIYYFLVDGCCGSACDVEITVNNACSFPEFGEFEEPVEGPDKACVGETINFTVGSALGANTYAWFVDGVLVDQTRSMPIDLDHTFLMEGTYEICVTAWHSPCRPLAESTRTDCHTITIVTSESGTPVAMPTPVCPGGVVNLSTSGHEDDPYFMQKLVVVNSAGIIVAVIDGDMGTYSFPGCGEFTLYSLNYSSQYTPVPNLMIGQPYSNVNCTVSCCDIASAPFSFAEEGSINFIDAPPDISVDCIDDAPPLMPLDWTSICSGNGSSPGTQTQGSYTPCAGGTITRTWIATDGCGVEHSHVQQITIDPIPVAQYDNPPADLTIPCSALAGLSHPSLNYTNNKLGQCQIQGIRPPVTTGTATVCLGGTLTNTWTLTDVCNRILEHQQVITVTPSALPTFVNPPADITIQCDALATFTPTNLNVTNNDMGACLINGVSMPVVSGNATICGGVRTVTWQYTDPCMRQITVAQNVTVVPAAAPAYVNPPANTTISCDALATQMPSNLSYTNGGLGNCLFSGASIPVVDNQATVCGGNITYTWSHLDQCSNPINHVQIIAVTPMAPPTFINPPANTTISCAQLATLPPAPNLSYSNNGLGNCLTDGNVPAVVTGFADVCGGTLTYTWNFTDQCSNSITHAQTITVTPIDPPAFISPPANQTIGCHELATLPPAPNLSYSNGGTASCLTSGVSMPTPSGSATVCGGTLTYTWEFTDQCSNSITHTQDITVTPIDPPAFVNPPANQTIACHELATLPAAPGLNYTNNGMLTCLTSGSATPTPSGSATVCGGTLTYTWEFTDQCSNSITHTQDITVTPIDPPAFVSPPANQTIACHELATLPAPLNLNYTNNGMATCLTSGSATPTPSGSATVCGGTLTYTWEFTDQCSNNITHTQDITVTPIDPPAFVNPPANQTIACHELATLPAAPPLSYTNNGMLTCLNSGTAIPTQSGNATVCGGTRTYMWEFTDQCNNQISHTQDFTVTPIDPPVFINPPAGITIPCNDAASYTALSLNYTNNGMATCLTTGVATPTLQGNPPNICGSTSTYTWTFTDQCNNTINHSQDVTVTPITPPVFNNPPANITVNCDAVPSGPADLTFQNANTGACSLSGSVPGTSSGTANQCGGVITYTWTFTDQCMNTINHVQTITVNPAPVPVFINPPPNITVACNQIPTIAPNLEYNNGGAGGCGVQGFALGAITGSANECGGTLSIMWRYTDPCGNDITHTQNITVLPAAPPSFTTLPPNITVTCANVPGSPPALSYTNNDICPIAGTVNAVQSGSYNPCGGTIQYTWQVTTLCGVALSHIQTITVLPSQAAQWINPPANITVNCADASITPSNLSYSNNEAGFCSINGTIQSSVFPNYSACGGNINKMWTFTDACGRSISHSQTITVLPSNPPVFTNPPPNITVSCGNIPSSIFLNYSNSANGTCSIAGQVLSVESGNYNQCGGTMFNNWTYTDQCNRTISYQRQITVLQADEPIFFNPQPDITLACDENVPPPFSLSYGNGASGICNIFGQITPTVQVNGNVTTYTWRFTHPCNGMILEHVRNITSPPNPVLVLDPDQADACEGQGFNINDINPQDFNGNNTVFTYYWDMPFEPGNEIVEFNIFPTVPTVIYVVATNEFGCIDFKTFTINIITSPKSGIGRNDTICTGTIINLFDYLTAPYDAGGIWRRNSGPTVNVSNPNSVNITTAGSYRFEYRVLGIAPCIDAYTYINILARPKPAVNVLQRDCSSDKTMYDVLVNSTNVIVTSTLGTVVDNGNNTVSIVGVPINNNVTITVTDLVTGCTNMLEVLPPNCDCPQVEPPANPTDLSICFGGINPVLSVSVDPLLSANWFDFPTGGTLLAGNTLQYTSTETNPGTYTYYVESYLVSDITCVSSSRTLVTFTIFDLPTANNASLEKCDDDVDGFVSFSLLPAIPIVNSGSDVTITFHVNLTDALSGANPLGQTFTNTLPGSQIIYASVLSTDNCRNTSQITLVVNPQPSVIVAKTDEVCDNDDNGTATISTSSTGGMYMYRINGRPYSSQTLYTALQPGNYTAYVQDQLGCIGQRMFTIDPGLILITNSFAIFCSDNGTKSDATDDFYTISWTILNNKNNIGTYRVLENNVEIGVYNYNELASIIRSANGQQLTFIFEDVTNGCRATVTPNPLVACSSDCEVIISQINETCNDNGTPTNPNDDTYTITFIVDKLNNPSSNSFNVYNGAAFVGNFTYGTSHNITLMADGQTKNLIFRDGLSLLCENMAQVGPLEHCSNECAIQITELSKVCNNNNTKTDATDDFYTITINANALNAPGSSNSFRVFINNVEVAIFQYGVGGTFVLPANGLDQIVEIRDADLAGCTHSQNTGILIPCSTDCQITISNLVWTCDNNNTSSDNTDDFYRIEFLVTAVNGAANGRFEVRVNNVLIGDYAYGFSHIITIPADGMVKTITFTDSADPSCFETRNLSPFVPCSGQCVIAAVVSNIVCDDNGTPTNTADDRYYFDLTVTGVNTGASYTFLLNNTTGTYGTTRTLGPFQISGGTINSFVVDISNPACIADVMVVPPAPCSSGCALNISNFQKTGCNNNGTNDDNNDDFYNVSFVVNTQFAGATQYTVTYNSITAGPFNYGQVVTLTNIPSDGVEYTFAILDINAGNCMASFKAQDFPCSACSQVITVSINPSILDCNNNVATLTATSTSPGIFNWTGPNNYSQFGLVVQASFPGWYYFKATYPDMCEAMDSVQLFTDANLPQSVGGPDKDITCLINEVTLMGSTNVPNSDAKYTWFDAAGNIVGTGKDLMVTTPGTYYLEVEDITNNCKSGRDAVVVNDKTMEPLAVIFADPGNILDCVIGSIELSGQPQVNVIFNWTVGELSFFNQNSVTITQPGTIFMMAVDTITGCDNSTSVEIKDFTGYPILNVDPVDPITCSTNSTIISATNSQQGPNLIFTWFNSNNVVIPNQTGNSLTVNSPGVYYVMLTDTANGCRDIDTILVTKIGDFPNITVSNDISLFCGPTQANLSVNIINPVSQTHVSWTTIQGTILGSAASNSVLVEGSGVYVVEVYYINSGCTTLDSVNVLVNTDTPRSISANITDETCVDERNGQISISEISGGTPPYDVRLNNTNYGQVTSISSL